MRSSLVPLSPGRLCGTHRRLSSGSSSPIVTRAIRALSLCAAGLLCMAPLAAQCPAIGNDATCGFVITVTDAGVAISAIGNQPTTRPLREAISQSAPSSASSITAALRSPPSELVPPCRSFTSPTTASTATTAFRGTDWIVRATVVRMPSASSRTRTGPCPRLPATRSMATPSP